MRCAREESALNKLRGFRAQLLKIAISCNRGHLRVQLGLQVQLGYPGLGTRQLRRVQRTQQRCVAVMSAPACHIEWRAQCDDLLNNRQTLCQQGRQYASAAETNQAQPTACAPGHSRGREIS